MQKPLNQKVADRVEKKGLQEGLKKNIKSRSVGTLGREEEAIRHKL